MARFVSGKCILCGGRVSQCFQLPAVPVDVSALYFDAAEAAQARIGTLALEFCDQCGAIFNSAWDPAAVTYDSRYENSLDASAVFTDYADELARRLRTTYSLQNCRIVEIGCGQARFLRKLCELSGSTGKGFDPSYGGPANDGCVQVEKRMFRVDDAVGARMILCRHVLEHLEDPLHLIAELAQIVRTYKETILYFEVPNAALILEGGLPWDLIYPHVFYFTMDSLISLFRFAGLDIYNAGTAYFGQFLFVEAGCRADVALVDSPLENARLRRLATALPGVMHSAIQRWQHCLAAAQRSGTRLAFWGAGAKGVTFLNIVPGAREIEAVIDLNPRKRDTFIPGTAQRVTSPEALRSCEPEAVISLNPIYASEIRTALYNMQLDALVVSDPEGLLV